MAQGKRKELNAKDRKGKNPAIEKEKMGGGKEKQKTRTHY